MFHDSYEAGRKSVSTLAPSEFEKNRENRDLLNWLKVKLGRETWVKLMREHEDEKFWSR